MAVVNVAAGSTQTESGPVMLDPKSDGLEKTGGAIDTLKREVGMETAIQYRFSRESPVSPGTDPRPWENTVKTKHEMLVTASAPAPRSHRVPAEAPPKYPHLVLPAR